MLLGRLLAFRDISGFEKTPYAQSAFEELFGMSLSDFYVSGIPPDTFWLESMSKQARKNPKPPKGRGLSQESSDARNKHIERLYEDMEPIASYPEFRADFSWALSIIHRDEITDDQDTARFKEACLTTSAWLFKPALEFVTEEKQKREFHELYLPILMGHLISIGRDNQIP